MSWNLINMFVMFQMFVQTINRSINTQEKKSFSENATVYATN